MEWLIEFWDEHGIEFVFIAFCFILLMFGIAATMGHLEPIYYFFFGDIK